ncbi:ParA family protein [Nitrogeniibacter aestuarii]|uniref:ParA family protein n=1 Tax=Nitrogeniibacter aestuarii TaxID=2815343 RepID=UPI001E6020A8|nr:ParA family protein [Nitrogeniibacter aestuarii]
MIVISVISTKGGVGKTTLCANLGCLLADMGLRVLLVDADVQPSLSRYFPIEFQADDGLTRVVKSGVLEPGSVSSIKLPLKSLPGVWWRDLNPNGQVDIVISDTPGGELQDWLSPRIDRGVRLRMALRARQIQEHYEVVLIDTQGAVGHLQDAAVLAADILISPVSPDVLSSREYLSRTLDLLTRLEPAKSTFGIDLPPLKAIINKADRTNDCMDIIQWLTSPDLVAGAGFEMLRTEIPHSTVYRSAATARQPVHWRDTAASEVMHQLVWELIPELHGCTADVSRTKKVSEESGA